MWFTPASASSGEWEPSHLTQRAEYFRGAAAGGASGGSFKIKSYSRVPITTSELGVHMQPHAPLSFKIIEKKAPYFAAKL